MNCERVEGYLSAFLDGALDSRLNEQVRAHLAQCAHCREILDDFRSFDHLLATQPRIEPPASLRARIFESEEYQRIKEERAAIESGATDLPDILDPGAPRALPGSDPEVYQLPPDLDPGLDPGLDANPYASDEVLPRVVEFPNHDAMNGERGSDEALIELAGPVDGAGDGDEDAPQSEGMVPAPRGGVPLWSRMVLPAAAIFMLTLATALMMKQGFMTFSSTTASGTSITLGNPGNSSIPLAAGARVVYLHDGILWSAPESGPGLKQPLTASGSGGVTVGNWSVSPNGQLVAYVDQRSATLHVVRSDGLSDHIVAKNVTGGITWSPDGTRAAYLAGAQRTQSLHVVKTDGSEELTLSQGDADASGAVWSSDSQWVAFGEARVDAVSVWTYSLASQSANMVTANADAVDAEANVAQLAWLPDTGHPGVTWASADANGVIEGVYSQSALADGSATQQLSPAGARYTAAAYTPTHSGAWLVADGNALTLVAANGTRKVVATLDTPASRIVWSPAGTAAVTHGSALSLWTFDSGLVAVDTGLSGIPPVWSGDSSSLLYAKTNSVEIAHVTNGKVDTTAVLQAVDVNALGIAPDSQSIALATSGWVVVASPDGMHVKVVDHHAPTDGHLVWSVAG